MESDYLWVIDKVDKKAGESVWVKITLTQFTTVGNAHRYGVSDNFEKWVKNFKMG